MPPAKNSTPPSAVAAKPPLAATAATASFWRGWPFTMDWQSARMDLPEMRTGTPCQVKPVLLPTALANVRRSHALRASPNTHISAAPANASSQTSGPTGAVPNSQLPAAV